ncbi:MAG: hypothetical protein KJ069_14835 [Anaerolineae bacterium]|nr:hypothetical protein [Anaerolineae bacterium]
MKWRRGGALPCFSSSHYFITVSGKTAVPPAFDDVVDKEGTRPYTLSPVHRIMEGVRPYHQLLSV